MKNRIVLSTIIFLIIISFNSFSATVIKKEDAAMYSKKSDYATVLEQGSIEQQIAEGIITIDAVKQESNKATTLSEDDMDRFKVVKATKNGNKYTNTWSDYNITLEDKNSYAGEFYDFSDPSTVFDFGVYFGDYSRLAVYYSNLSRTLDEVAKIFSPDSAPNDVVIAGNKYRHVRKEVSYPFGMDYFNYYLRDVDGKLMVIECFCENDENGIASNYIDRFMKNS